MSDPAISIVYFEYQQHENRLTPLGGGLRDATAEELEHPPGHGWTEAGDDRLRLYLAVEGFAIRPMAVAMEHIAQHEASWRDMAVAVLGQLHPDCTIDYSAADEAAE